MRLGLNKGKTVKIIYGLMTGIFFVPALCAMTGTDMAGFLKMSAAGIFNLFSDMAGRNLGVITVRLDGAESGFFGLVIFIAFLFGNVVCAAYDIYATGLISAFVILPISAITGRSPGGFVFPLICGAAGLFYTIRTGRGSERHFSVKRLLAAVSICAACMIFGFAAGGERSDALARVSGFLKEASDRIRYGKGALTDGDLTDVGAFAPEDKTVLEVRMKNPQSYYLRGFVGETYTGRSWEKIDSGKKYEYADAFYLLHKNGFYGQSQLSAGGLAAAAEDSGFTAEENELFVKNIGASSEYIYAPYEVKTDGTDSLLFDSGKIGDEALTSQGFFGSEEYSLKATENLVKKYTDIAAFFNESTSGNAAGAGERVFAYLNDEARYNNYVYDAYLDIPENLRSMLEKMLPEGSFDGAHEDYGAAKRAILQNLTGKYAYSETPAKTPAETGFIEAFLSEGQSGYSVHFASAAVMMFRYYGIPARYVEGYLITPKAVSDSNGTVYVNEKDAHAWVEFYQDAVGWIPFEVTPGYLNVMEKAKELGSVTENQDQLFDAEKGAQNREDIRDEGSFFAGRFLIFIIIAAAVLIALLIIAAVKLIKKHNYKKRVFATFSGPDINLAVRNMFAYAVNVFGPRKDLKDLAGEERYLEAYELYERAVFGNCALDKEDLERMRSFFAEVSDTHQKPEKL